MKILTSLLSIIILSVLLFVGEYGTNSIPPLGKILNPTNGFWKNADKININFEHKIINAGNNSTTYIDEQMIPIYQADKFDDALFAQGYFHAKMRLWQMDFITRVSAGRLSEILGPRAIKFDKLQRRRGLSLAAKNTIAALDNYPKTKASIEAYTAGVNYYIDQLDVADYPFEYKLLNYVPEKWSSDKCGLILKYMAYILAGRERDIPRTNALQYFGPKKFKHIYPRYNKLQSPVISKSQTYDYIDSIIPFIEYPDTNITDFILNPLIEQPDKDNGSNNWAVSGDKTKEGSPILCNDPHLSLGLPSIWIQNQILTNETHVHGVSIPGVPGIIIGFNEHLAWGVTNGGHDVLDWYKMDWVNEQKQAYWLDGKKVNVEFRIETIHIKNQLPILDTIKTCYWGPIVYESEKDNYYDLAMRWAVIDPTTTNEMGAFLNLNKAKTYEEYRSAISGFKTPLQNSVYADKLGNIAMTLQGQILLKLNSQGRFVQNGNNSNNNWQGYIPVEHNPQEKNPARHYVSSANQISTDTNYPYHYVSGDFRPYRGRILNRYLKNENNFDIDKMKELQQSSYNLKAEDLLPAVINNIKGTSLNNVSTAIIQEFKNWDYNYEQNNSTPIKFELFWKSMYNNIWDEIFSLKDSINLHRPLAWRTIELIRDSPSDEVFDIVGTNKKEELKDIIIMALNETAHQYDSLEVNNWSDYKNTHIDHLLKLDGFNYNNIQSGGVRTALNAIKETHGPSWRVIVSLSDTIEAYGIFPGGQSGNPGSYFYDNQIDAWAKGQYPKISFTKDMDEIKKRSKIIYQFGQ